MIFTGFSSSYASHIPGGNLTWACTGNPNEYIVTMQMFVSCPSSLSSTYTGTISNTCGLANPTLVMPQVGVAQEVSQICSAQMPNSACNGGTIPGVMMYTYQATVTLPGGCNTWDFAFSLCCRDANSNTAGTSTNTMYFHSGMNSITAPCDASPYVTASPIPYVCAGQTNTYCPGAIDADGDSLSYSLVSPLGASAVPIAYLAPYSVAAPLQNLVLDPTSGCITFNQPTTGNFVVTYLIEAWDAAGNLTGFIYHDYQFEVITCTNITPTPPAGGIVLTSGNATQMGPNLIELCEGSTACFSMTFTDADPGTVLSIDTAVSNIFTVFPGATITTTGTSPFTIDICWTVPAGTPSQVVATITVTDDACPIEGTATQVAIFDVVTSTVANAPMTICGGQTGQLSAAGGSIFNWTIVPGGDPINVGTNFSCNPCDNPIATPSVTTSYIVTSNLSGGCDNVDTTTVTIVPDFTPTVSQSAQSACLFDPVQLNVAVNPATAGYSYLWYPNNYLNSDTIANPSININVPGTYTYYVDVTSPAGCLKTDSIVVTIVPFVAPTINILTPDSFMACGDSILIDLDLGGGIPAVSGPSATNTCSQPSTQTIVGTGTTNISSAPSPYYGFYEDGRIQMIYTPAEINAAGFVGGKITEMGWYITLIGGQSYNNLTIKMGVTALNNFNATTTFVTGLTQVFNTANFTPVAVGWTTHTLNTAYEWDGVSNLIIEVCFDNAAWTSTDPVAQTATVDKMTLYDYTDGAAGCTLNTPYNNTQQNNRPNIRFTQCPTIPDPNAFDYAWTPATTIMTSTMQNPTVFPSIPTSYIVTVTDTGGNCSDTDTLNVTVLCGACYQPAITVTNPTCKDGTNGSIVIDPTFVLESEVQSFTWQDSITGAVLQTTMNLTAGMLDSLVNIGAGAYTIIMVDSSGCSQDTTIYLTEPDSVMISSITSSAGALICIGGTSQVDAIAIDGNGGSYTYTWTDLTTGTAIPGNGPHTVNPILPTNNCYSVFATDPLGCISSISQVCIDLFPSIIATTPNGTAYNTLTVCPGTANGGPFSTDIEMSAIGGMGAPFTYTWYDNGTQIGTNSNGIINVTPTSAPTTYIGVATDNCTTPGDSVWITVEWFDVITPDFSRDSPDDSCYSNTPIKFTNTSTPTALVDFPLSEWVFSDGTTLNGDPVSAPFNSPVCRDLTLTATSTDGCRFSLTRVDYVCPHDYPNANYSMDPPITDLLNTDIQFTNLSTGGTPPLNYLWNFNSGLYPDTSVATHPNFTFTDTIPGTYPVLLTTTDANGCQDTIVGTVVVNGIYLFYVPNSFTPDGDGLNDLFRPYGEGIDLTNYTMQIFDRWGGLIYQSSNAERGWDGTYKGKSLSAGSYVWKIVAREEYGTVIHDNYGHVNLIR